ncbi:MAG: hypothetical protein ACFFC7_25220, partial [Candidatus Hermodarchaeota archaeon]
MEQKKCPICKNIIFNPNQDVCYFCWRKEQKCSYCVDILPTLKDGDSLGECCQVWSRSPQT